MIFQEPVLLLRIENAVTLHIKHFVDFGDFRSINDLIMTLKPLKYFSQTVLLLLFLTIARHAFTPIWLTSNA